MIEFTVDGQRIKTENDKSILEAALEAGVYIPHLCHHPELEPTEEIRSLNRVFQGGAEKEGEVVVRSLQG